MNLLKISVLVFSISSLIACTNVAMTSASAVYNRHGIEKNVRDQYLTMQAFKSLKVKSDEFKNANISVATFHDEVLLAGQVPEAWQKEKADAIVKKIPGVLKTYNQLQVGSPSSSLTRVSDAWITAKIKTKMLASDDIDSSQIKVITENGNVYLMGTLLPEEADAAVEMARTTSGVRSVVKVFSYITISKNRIGAKA